MICPTCKRAMVELFTSTGCDHCDYGPPMEKLHRGFAVLPPVTCANPHYVFRTRLDAERWMGVVGTLPCEIREVLSLEPYRWHLSHGVVRDLVFADHVFDIFEDHRYEPLPHRAFIAPRKE